MMLSPVPPTRPQGISEGLHTSMKAPWRLDEAPGKSRSTSGSCFHLDIKKTRAAAMNTFLLMGTVLLVLGYAIIAYHSGKASPQMASGLPGGDGVKNKGLDDGPLGNCTQEHLATCQDKDHNGVCNYNPEPSQEWDPSSSRLQLYNDVESAGNDPRCRTLRYGTPSWEDFQVFNPEFELLPRHEITGLDVRPPLKAKWTLPVGKSTFSLETFPESNTHIVHGQWHADCQLSGEEYATMYTATATATGDPARSRTSSPQGCSCTTTWRPARTPS